MTQPPPTESTPSGRPDDPLEALDQLILRGHQVLHICGWNGKAYTAFTPRGVESRRMQSEAVDLIRRSFGEDSRWYEKVLALANDQDVDVPRLIGLLEHARDTWTRESMFHIPAQLLMQLGGDLIELAELLANAGHRRPAAAQSVRVLVTKLRERALAWPDLAPLARDMEPDQLNDALFERGAYVDADHLRIAACIRIGADLGGERADQIPDGELDDTVSWVRSFVLRRAG